MPHDTKQKAFELTERAKVVLEIEFGYRPSKSFGQRDTDDGWGAELDCLDYYLCEVQFASGTVLSPQWLASHGFFDVVMNKIDRKAVIEDIECYLESC